MYSAFCSTKLKSEHLGAAVLPKCTLCFHREGLILESLFADSLVRGSSFNSTFHSTSCWVLLSLGGISNFQCCAVAPMFCVVPVDTSAALTTVTTGYRRHSQYGILQVITHPCYRQLLKNSRWLKKRVRSGWRRCSHPGGHHARLQQGGPTVVEASLLSSNVHQVQGKRVKRGW